MNNKIIVGLLVIALFLGGYNFLKKTEVIVKDGEVVQVGAAGPYQNVDFLSFPGGFEPTWRTDDFQTSTSTLCAIPFPSATSTIDAVYVNPTTQDTTGGTLRIATSSTPYATTTVLFTSISFKAQPVVWIASTTETTGSNRYLKPNGGYVVVDVSGKTSYDYAGKCYARFTVFR
jgi:hypothetical protein